MPECILMYLFRHQARMHSEPHLPLCDDPYRSSVILGLHEYACVVATSGFIGGYPNNAGVAPGDATKKGIDLCLVSNWPKSTALTTTMFHAGRFKFITAFCRMNGINPPRMILTEHGFDDVSDVKPWAETLPQTPPYYNSRGFKSLVNAWSFLFPQWRGDRARAYFEFKNAFWG
jgi:hypothetical protein